MKLRRSPKSRLVAILLSVALAGVACSKSSGGSQSGSVNLLTFKSAPRRLGMDLKNQI